MGLILGMVSMHVNSASNVLSVSSHAASLIMTSTMTGSHGTATARRRSCASDSGGDGRRASMTGADGSLAYSVWRLAMRSNARRRVGINWVWLSGVCISKYSIFFLNDALHVVEPAGPRSVVVILSRLRASFPCLISVVFVCAPDPCGGAFKLVSCNSQESDNFAFDGGFLGHSLLQHPV